MLATDISLSIECLPGITFIVPASAPTRVFVSSEAFVTTAFSLSCDGPEFLFMFDWIHAELEAAEASMTSIDRLGFYLRLKTAEGMKGTRINFQYEVRTPQETREVLIEMLRQAKALA